ncbi:MAG: hypothetical protein OXG53_10095 [Chloroflexi bacterium]|nr:hypothetical protein [Chloroflexota bacterium]
MPKRILSLLLTLLFGGLPMNSAQDSPNDIALIVYNVGAALIQEQRSLTLDEGINSVTLGDIAATIDPSSVMFKSLSDPAGTAVLEQSYRHNALDAYALLAPYVRKNVEITIADGVRFSGELLSLRDDQAILRMGPTEIVYISRYDIRGLTLPAPALDINPGPELRLLLRSESAGEQDVELSYLAGGMNWTADYHVILEADESALDLKGMVTLSNHSGRGYQNAALKLVAGEVSRIETEGEEFAQERMMAMSADAGIGGGGAVEQRDLSEYKLYAIARPISIADRDRKQIEFVSGAGIAANITYVFDSSPAFRGYYSPIDYIEGRGVTRAEVRTRLAFSTGGASGLGADLPAGRVRVYQADVDGAILLVGEDVVSHSPQGEDVMLDLGAAFDLTGERVQTDFSFVSRRVARESFEIKLRNRKADESANIIVPERLYRWRDWQITESSAPFVKVDNASIEFEIAVAPGAEESLTYTVEYSFPEEE